MHEAALNAVGEFLKEGTLSLPIAGDCMRPSLQRGEDVVIEPVRRLLTGDVLLFREGQTLVAHRFLGWIFLPHRKGARLHAIVKADRAKRPDAPVARQACLGRVKTPVTALERLQAGRAYGLYLASALRQKVIFLVSTPRSSRS